MLEVILCTKFLTWKKIFIYLFISLFSSFYFGYKFNLTFPLTKCPVCYGVELCPLFEDRIIQLSWSSFLLTTFNSKLTKSVYHGFINQTAAIVLKKKAARVSEFYTFSSQCSTLQESALNNGEVQNVIFCPGFTSLEFLFKQVEDVEKKKLWLDTRISIEPLLLMLLQQYNWPIPKYYGACGDVIIEDYRGEPLLKFTSSSFETRAFLAVELLKMAHLFTFGHPDFIFYFTDYSFYNLVVDSKGKITLADLDNVIIFNKSSFKDNYFIKNTIHISKNYGINEYAFSPLDICNHYLSDHNYFSVCKYLLTHSGEGLLKDISKVLGSNSHIFDLLDECSELKNRESRFSAGQELQIQLKMLIESRHWKFNN